MNPNGDSRLKASLGDVSHIHQEEVRQRQVHISAAERIVGPITGGL